MHERLGRSRWVLLGAIILLLTLAGAPTAVARSAPNSSSTTVDPGDTTTTATTDLPASTTPDVPPATSPDTAPDPPPADTLVGADPDPDGGDVALVAIVGLVVVLSLAAWWMARRDEERPVPDPPSGEVL